MQINKIKTTTNFKAYLKESTALTKTISNAFLPQNGNTKSVNKMMKKLIQNLPDTTEVNITSFSDINKSNEFIVKGFLKKNDIIEFFSMTLNSLENPPKTITNTIKNILTIYFSEILPIGINFNKTIPNKTAKSNLRKFFKTILNTSKQLELKNKSNK